MKTLLNVLGVILAIWFIVKIFQCNGSIPYCIGWSLKAVMTGLAHGLGLM
jgi:hypothetical protein